MLNQVILIGNLTDGIDLRYTGTGKIVGSFSLAVDRNYKQNGQPTVDFIRCVVFGKTAELIRQYTLKGSLIGVAGRLKTRSYQSNGHTVHVCEVIVHDVSFLGSRAQQTAPQPAIHPQTSSAGVLLGSAPSSGMPDPQPSSPIAPSDMEFDEDMLNITEDDLPF